MSKKQPKLRTARRTVAKGKGRRHNNVAGRADVQMRERGRAYPAEYRRHIVELVRGGRTAAQLASEFECSRESIRNWVKRAQQEEGRAMGDTTVVSSTETRCMLKENRRLREECRILREVVALFARASVVHSAST